MNPLSRRTLFRAALGAPAILRAANSTDIRIEGLHYDYEDLVFRTPMKFGGLILNRSTLLNVHCEVRSIGGRTAKGLGSMPLSPDRSPWPRRRPGNLDGRVLTVCRPEICPP
jgi:hypothetical protein